MPTSRRIPGTAFRPGRTLALVLVVLQDSVLAEAVCAALWCGPYLVRRATDILESGTLLGECQPDLVVLDVDYGDGQAVDRLWRQRTPLARIPVIALTRRFDLQTRLNAFQTGVDDILAVPFSPKELAARTLAVMRRTYLDSLVFAPAVRLDGLEIDMRDRDVRVGGEDLRLTELERSLLYLLAASAGRPVSREQILDCLWGADYVSQSNVVDRHVCNLRMKLGRLCGRPPVIVTVPGRGYRLVDAPVRWQA